MNTKRFRQLAVVVASAAIAVVAIIVLGKNSSQARDFRIQENAWETEALFEGIPQRRTVLGKQDAPSAMA